MKSDVSTSEANESHRAPTRCRHGIRRLGELSRLAFLLVVLAAFPGIVPAWASAVVLPSAADGSVHIIGEARVLVDAERDLTIETVRAPEAVERFRSIEADSGDISLGYSSAPHWLRFDVRAPYSGTAPQRGRWFLEVAYPALDRVEFYLGDDTEPLVAGDRVAFSTRPVAHRNLVFPLDLLPGESTTVILKVETEGSLTIPLVLWDASAFNLNTQKSYSLLALYYGALAALLLYNFLLYLSIRDRRYLEYVLMLSGMLVGQVSYNGFGNQFLWPESTWWGHIALPVGLAFSGVFSAMFARSFLGTRASAPWLDRILLGFAALFAINIAAMFVLPYVYGAAALPVLGILFALTAVASGVRCWMKDVPGAELYLLAWTAVLLGAAVVAARYHTWVPTNVFTTYAMQVGSALEMLLLSFALANSINILRRERTRAQNEALASQARLVQTLQRSEQVLAQRVAQRTLELERANEQLERNQERLEHIAHHDPLTGLANRLLLDDRIEHGITRARRHNARMVVLLADLDGFKPVNDELGHAAGDELLVAVAGRLQHLVRAEDTVARLGGDEFVLVLEEVFDTEDANRVASGVAEELAKPFQIRGGNVTISASVGFAFFPEDGKDAASLLQAADKAMYHQKEQRQLARITAAKDTPTLKTGS
ncbi:MAG TPA: diguanylate cyclase [Rhodocyclaceae bacterium]|nr:diguanylate cyclase [Rhodocyclaceae bacterium]HRQ45650.1 diguanylate cyclase [Rhodocyclaceae bacterium]